MVSCMYIFHHCTLRFEGNTYIIIIIIIIIIKRTAVFRWPFVGSQQVKYRGFYTTKGELSSKCEEFLAG